MWKDYIQKTSNKPVSKYLVEAVKLSSNRQQALDLGSGSGMASKYLADNGFHVEAVDFEASAGDHLAELIRDKKAIFRHQAFADFMFQSYDLIHASYALPFISKNDFPTIWPKLKASLKPNGIFVAEFFGPQDSWNTGATNMSFHSQAQIQALLQNWHILTLDEEHRQGSTANGQQKTWHVFHIIAQRPVT